MKIQFLGTGASPSTPLPFCQCNVCKQARKIGGKNYRRRSSVLINKDLLIDIGPDFMSSFYAFEISYSDISICLQTHFHEDHFDPEMMISRHSDYGSEGLRKISLAASKNTLEFLDQIISRRCDYGSLFNENVAESLKMQLIMMNPYIRYEIGNYNIIGLPANHGLPEHGCFNYVIEDDESCVLYLADTSIIHNEVWDFLTKTHISADLIILDCTYGIGYNSKKGDHLATKDFINHVQRFREDGLLKNTGVVYATHISHEGILEHDLLDKYGRENGFRIAYDGLILNV